MNNDQTNVEFYTLSLIDDVSNPDDQSEKAFNEKLARSEKGLFIIEGVGVVCGVRRVVAG